MDAFVGIQALEEAIKIAGGQAALARQINTKQQNISWWLKKSKKVPADKAIAIENVTGITRQRLRPDIFSQDTLQ